MIAKLTGRLDSSSGNAAIIDVQGVGYLVQCPGRVLSRLGPAGSPVSLLIDTHVREDAITLYGFADTGERDWFRLLITIQGVGPKVALSLLSALSPEQLILAMAARDKAALTRADGVGPKLAERLISELKDKVAGLSLGTPTAASASAPLPAADGATGDAVSALVNLGYGRSEAMTAVAKAAKTGATDVARLIPLALKELSS